MGAAFMMLLAATLGGVGLGVAAVRGANLNKYKPTWMLAIESRSIGTRFGDAAAAELAARLAAGELPVERAQALIRRGLELQADPSGPWSAAWSDVLGAAWGKDLLDADQRVALVRNALEFTFVMRQRVHAGEASGILIGWLGTRLPSNLSVSPRATMTRCLIGGQSVETPKADGVVTMIGGTGQCSIGTTMKVDGPVGVHECLTTWQVAVAPTGGTPAMEYQLERRNTLEIVAPEISLVRVVPDDSVRPALQAAVRITGCTATRSSSPSAATLSGSLQIKNPPVNVAFDVFARDPASGREWKLNGVSAAAVKGVGSSTYSTGLSGELPGFSAPTVDFVLRPSIEEAVSTPAIETIWGGELVFAGVPVQWSPSGDAQPDGTTEPVERH